MPTYEYQCQACGHHMEAFQSMSEKALTTCPACHAASLNKLISAAAFQLKGSGWYKTDYSDKGKAKTENTSTTNEKTQAETTAKPSSEASTNANEKSSATKDKKPKESE